jgi:DNA-binding GntR family transcriptional regulator
VRRALEALRAEGLVASKPGVGWIVQRVPVPQSLARLSTIEEQLRELGRRPQRKILSSSIRPASGRVEEVLGGGDVREVVRLNLVDGEPFARVTVWAPVHVAGHLSITDLERSSFYELLEATGALKRPLAWAHQSIRGIAIDERDAELLGVAAGAVGLCCERITYDTADQPVLLSEFVFPASRVLFEVNLSSEVSSIGPSGLRLAT